MKPVSWNRTRRHAWLAVSQLHPVLTPAMELNTRQVWKDNPFKCNVGFHWTFSFGSEHLCTNTCQYVRCVKEDNEKNVFHAFSIAKSSDYAITEVIPTQFPFHPTCRWMVAYSHFNDPVSTHNSKEKFDEITKVIPKNVQVIHTYIRCNSSKLFAAYVVVYGVVKCRCPKPVFGPVPVKRDVFRKSKLDPLVEQASVGFRKQNYDPLSAQPSDSNDLGFSFVDIKQET